MGQKVSPHGLRVGVIKDWDSKWYASKLNNSNNKKPIKQKSTKK